MNVKHYSQGKYLVNSRVSYHKAIEEWIQGEQFLQFENIDLQLNKKSRKRNTLYCFQNTFSSNNLIMKVSQISKEYKFWRKVDLFITSLFKDYNYNSYNNSVKLQSAGIDTIIPIAYWTYGFPWLNRKSYFLYEKVEYDITVTELCNKIVTSNIQNKSELIDAVTNQCIAIVKKIHAANIRHDDPHGGNILTNLELSTPIKFKVSDIKNARFTLIDNDRCTSARVSVDIVKRFFDLKCLTRFNICQISPQNLLRLYLGNKYTPCWWYVFKFWKSGGFSIKRRLDYFFEQKI